MGLRRLAVAALWLGVLGGCGAVVDESTGPSAAQAPLTLADLAHRRWVLQTINDEPVASKSLGTYDKGIAPELDFGETPHVAGFAGCNRYRGNAQLSEAGEFQVARLATTMMMCPQAAMALEKRFTALLETGARLTIEGQYLSLTHNDERWLFRIADWVQ
ncbi:META domain-containing protein [Simiduia sp. 21SJ11W-1]|uniref:META domain-containing protein n=1 Tax=Simiduia sp. 21SJ11W-1 TaxID=2909669 RepID=UPI0020A0EE2E|nr:META domain-containing protein [Simiduia sp. 21SJ11W-1]UTA48586.1 META domain-containing protein [Simiduia sp. 21SJ11W-1]